MLHPPHRNCSAACFFVDISKRFVHRSAFSWDCECDALWRDPSKFLQTIRRMSLHLSYLFTICADKIALIDDILPNASSQTRDPNSGCLALNVMRKTHRSLQIKEFGRVILTNPVGREFGPL